MPAEEEVLALEERLRWADASPDPDTSGIFAELFAPDVLMVGARGVFDVEEVLSSHRAPRRHTFDAVEIRDRTVRTFGDVVVVTCQTDYVVGSRRFSLRAVRVWRRQAGAWKIAVVALMEPPTAPSH